LESTLFKEITPQELQCFDREYFLLDVRRPDEVAQGMIPNARHVVLDALPANADALPKDQPLIVYCAKGGRSAQACAFLAAKGFRDLYNLEGGIEAWRKEGGELVQP
jgi:rhodanese-related sulfurtransferase